MWWQTRSFDSITFDIGGRGSGPTDRQIETWAEIDDDLAGFIGRCVALTIEYVAELLNERDLRVELTCLKAMAAAGASGGLELTNIDLNDDCDSLAHLTYSGFDDHGLYPIIFCRGRRVEEVIITP